MTLLQKLTPVTVLALLCGCAANPQGDGNLYTYVDAQGNLVTLEKSRQQQDREAAATGAGQAQAGNGPDGASYQTDEQVQAGLEARDRNRFITYPGPDGQVVQERVDLVAERENEASRPPGYDPVDAPPAFVERMLGIRADCCLHTRDQARAIEAGEELLLNISVSEQTLALDPPTPGVTLALEPGLEALRLRGFVDKQGRYVAPGIVFMDEQGAPVLVVDRPYQRRYAETWYRYAFFEGRVAVPPEARYAAFYLPYAAREGDAGVQALAPLQDTYENAPDLVGELTVYAASGR